MERKETVSRFLEEWLPSGDWDLVSDLFTEDVTYVDANNMATSGKDAVVQLLRKGNRLARLIWKDAIIPPNRVTNSVLEDDQIFAEWVAEGLFKNGVEVRVPGGTLVRFREGRIAYYRDYVNFALFVQWAQQYPEVFRDLAQAENM